MDWLQAKDSLLIALIGIIGVYCSTQFRELVRSVQDLNIQIAKILEYISDHKEKLEDHKLRLEKLEEKSFKSRKKA